MTMFAKGGEPEMHPRQHNAEPRSLFAVEILVSRAKRYFHNVSGPRNRLRRVQHYQQECLSVLAHAEL